MAKEVPSGTSFHLHKNVGLTFTKEIRIQLVPLDFWNMLDLFIWIKLGYRQSAP